MKKIFAFLVMLLAVAGFSCQGSNNGFTVTGNIAGLPENAVLQFFPLSHVDQTPVGEVVVKKGKFTFKGEAPEVRGFLMVVKNNYGSLKFVTINGEQVKVDGKVIGTSERDGKVLYNFKDVKVSNSPSTDKFNQLMSGREAIDARFSALQKKYAHVHAVFMKEGQNPAVIDSVRKSADYQAMQAEEHKMFEELNADYRKVVLDNKDNVWGPMMMIALLSYLTPDNRKEYEALGPSAQNSYYGKMVRDELYPLGVPGDAVPAFSGVLYDGKKTTLAELYKGKKYVLVDFWASWCKPCRKEIPNIKKIYDKHKANGFDIVSVSIDENEAQWRKAVEKEAMVWPNLRDTDKSIAKNYHVSSVPTMYIIDGNGRLVAENLRGEELAAKIDELMGK